jgi:hypothetical protein
MTAPANGITRRRWLTFGAATAVVLLAGCSEEPEAVSAAPEADPARPVAQITDVEIGRTADGYALTVFGLTETAGWGTPELRLRGTRPDTQGMLNFDFVAVPSAEAPASPMAQLPEARRVRADALLPEAFFAGLAGLRIHAASGPAEITFN